MSKDCRTIFNCCDCGGQDCGCLECYSCQACGNCNNREKTFHETINENCEHKNWND